METIYFYCATIGGGILVLQTLLLVLGAADMEVDTDITPDGDATLEGASSSIFLQLSLKTLIAFVTFFGLAGMACHSAGMGKGMTVACSTGAGLMAFYLVGYLMSLMVSLQSQGNLDLSKGVGEIARVDLRIPGQNQGYGKVRIALQGRTVISKAVTAGAEIPTGAAVTICAMRGHDTFEVESAARA